ncbi:MAG: hypothetical protein SFW09_20350 [Hyphomicrobiaceae bacterium]|nr:hypothetical protein [Hyphomicrobiaceae bacterium]
MLRLRWMLVCTALAVSSSAAPAFQETKGGVSGEPQAPAAARGAPAGQLDLKDTGVSVAPPTGVEVRIPGLGKLGVLPKFDFGLELLYGVGEQKSGTGDRQAPLSPEDDVQIRGSLKHRF